MSPTELKAEIHRKIEALESVAELLDVNQSLDWFINGNLTSEEKRVLTRLEQARKSAQEETGISHEDVMNEAKSWLTR